MPVSVEVDHDGIDDARWPLNHVLLELPSAFVLEPARFPGIVPEARDSQVEVAVAVEVAGPNIRDAGDVSSHHVGRESLSAVVFEDDHRPDPAVVGIERPKARDDEIEVAVPVDVHRFDVRRRQYRAAYRLLGVHTSRVLADPGQLVSRCVADEDVRKTVPVEVDDLNVGNLRPLAAANRIADALTDEEIGWRSFPQRSLDVRGGCVGRFA